MARSFSVAVAPTGARRSKADHPALPVTVQEIADTAVTCFDAGADMLHLHVRRSDGRHSLDVGQYREAIAAVAETAPNLAIQITTEAAEIYDVPDQLACLRQLAPRAASVSVREMARDEATAKRLYVHAAEAGTDIQHILYSADDIALLRTWTETGIVPKSMRSVLFVLGQYIPPVAGRPSDLLPFLSAAEKLDLSWSICAFGRNELACARAALQAGGNVRVGFENNTRLPDGRPARDNAELVALTVKEGLSLGLSHPPARKVA